MKDKRIISYLLNAGVKSSLVGFAYLYDAIEIVIKNNNIMPKPMQLYAMIAIRHDVKVKAMERQLRYAIECSTGDMKDLSNSEFISRSALEISLSN